MFFNIEQFNFLKPILKNKDKIFEEYCNYKEFIRNDPDSKILNHHLSNMETYDLITSFVMCIATTNKIGSGQITNGLFNFCYTMPDKNFITLKPLLEKKFDIYYKQDSTKHRHFFKNSLSYLDSIPNFTQCGYSEYKNNSIFEPHVHEDKLIVAHFLLNPNDDKLLITSNSQSTVLDITTPYTIFRGYDVHSAKAICKENIITFGIGFYE